MPSLLGDASILVVILATVATGGCNAAKAAPFLVDQAAAERGHLSLSSYLGGAEGYDEIRDVAVDRAGYVYLTGGTASRSFPTTVDAYATEFGGGATDAFVTKLTPDGRVVWSTLVGGPSLDRAYAIEVDGEGFTYISGRAGEGFPVTKGAFQPDFRGGPPNGPYPSQCGFVAKLSPDGRTLLWSSFFGAFDDPSHPVRDIVLNGEGDVLIASSSSTGRFPDVVREAFAAGFQPERSGARDAIVARISSDGTRVLWATYIGGSGSEWGEGSIRVASDGGVYYLTVTESTDVVMKEAYDSTFNGETDFLLAKLTPDGKLVFSTYLGGSGLEQVETHQLGVDRAGNPIVVAGTMSADFPVTSGAVQSKYAGSGHEGTGLNTNYPGDIAVVKLSADGRRWIASTLLGGMYGESAEGAAVDDDGNVYLTGATFSPDFPTTADAFQPLAMRGAELVAVKLSADLTRLLYATFLGTPDGEVGRAAAVGPGGELYVAGSSTSARWPLYRAQQPSFAGGNADGVVAKFVLGSNRE